MRRSETKSIPNFYLEAAPSTREIWTWSETSCKTYQDSRSQSLKLSSPMSTVIVCGKVAPTGKCPLIPPIRPIGSRSEMPPLKTPPGWNHSMPALSSIESVRASPELDKAGNMTHIWHGTVRFYLMGINLPARFSNGRGAIGLISIMSFFMLGGISFSRERLATKICTNSWPPYTVKNTLWRIHPIQLLHRRKPIQKPYRLSRFWSLWPSLLIASIIKKIILSNPSVIVRIPALLKWRNIFIRMNQNIPISFFGW